MKLNKREKITRLEVIYEQLERLTDSEPDEDIRKITYDVLACIQKLEATEAAPEQSDGSAIDD
jgi:hypothetical protein